MKFPALFLFFPFLGFGLVNFPDATRPVQTKRLGAQQLATVVRATAAPIRRTRSLDDQVSLPSAIVPVSYHIAVSPRAGRR
ncbi:MAG TPA: hypothetical protein VEQ65_09985 [Opitutus sp.]|nr:hypothetical protein [Opitutus sp.]